MDGFHGNYQYKIINTIGRGGFGCVEKIALFNTAGHHCGDYARKFLSGNFGEELDKFRRRFAREVAYQASCIHTNVANIYLCDLHAPQPWFIMDLADSDLQKDIESNALSMADKIIAIDMVLQGIAHVHEKNYLHRDIKPNNVLRFNGTYKVSDFGLVKNMDTEAESEVLTNITTWMGNQKYWAPEVATAAQYSVKSDIFSLGILIEDVGFPETSTIQDVIRKSTERRPFDRYTDVKEMREHFIAAAKSPNND